MKNKGFAQAPGGLCLLLQVHNTGREAWFPWWELLFWKPDYLGSILGTHDGRRKLDPHAKRELTPKLSSDRLPHTQYSIFFKYTTLHCLTTWYSIWGLQIQYWFQRMKQTDKCYCGDEKDKTKIVDNFTEESVYWTYSIMKNKQSDRKPID